MDAAIAAIWGRSCALNLTLFATGNGTDGRGLRAPLAPSTRNRSCAGC
jgi:hypothetical protein